MTLFLDPTASECPLCWTPEATLTEEDVFNSWLRRYLAARTPTPSLLPPRIVIWICESCNNNLGRVFDKPASNVLKHMMNRTDGDLTDVEQLIVAKWRIKTDLLYNLVRPVNYYIDGTELKTAEDYERDRAMVWTMLQSEGEQIPESTVRVGVVDFGNTAPPPPLLSGGWPKHDRQYMLNSVEPLGILLFESVIFFPGKRVGFVRDNRPRDDFPYLLPTVHNKISWPPPDLPRDTPATLRRRDWAHSPANTVGAGVVALTYDLVAKKFVDP